MTIALKIGGAFLRGSSPNVINEEVCQNGADFLRIFVDKTIVYFDF